jgi:class 3 adenylate cyclase
MADWIEWAKVVGGVLGAGSVATAAKLYHDRIVAGKDTELLIKDAELARALADLAKAEARADSAGDAAAPEGRDLGSLRTRLTERVERLAGAMRAQAATLYVPIFPARDDATEFPRGFAFVAVYNIDPAAIAAILKMKLVEAWTIVGECWSKGAMVGDNHLQSNVRHVASYDKQSGFTPVNTLVSPVQWRGRQVGVIQLFNKTMPGGAVDPRGFDADDRRALTSALQDDTDAGLAAGTGQFLSNREYARFLGLHGELDLENAAIMYVDLTRSSLLFDELPLVDAARLINRFNEHVYHRLGPYSAVVEKFSGDGTLVRFHYAGLDTDLPTSNPAFRAVCAAADLVKDFKDFKARYWKSLATDSAGSVKLRISITLGPAISTNVGPRQFQVPTVMGQCVNRAAKLIAYAPRDRDIVLVDDNMRKVLMQVDRAHADALRDFHDWSDPAAPGYASLAGHEYFEVAPEHFRLAAAELRQGSCWPTLRG